MRKTTRKRKSISQRTQISNRPNKSNQNQSNQNLKRIKDMSIKNFKIRSIITANTKIKSHSKDKKKDLNQKINNIKHKNRKKNISLSETEIIFKEIIETDIHSQIRDKINKIENQIIDKIDRLKMIEIMIIIQEDKECKEQKTIGNSTDKTIDLLTIKKSNSMFRKSNTRIDALNTLKIVKNLTKKKINWKSN